MWELDCEEGWVPKNWCFWTVVLEKTLESPLDCKEIQPVHSKGDQPWDFFGRNDAKAETPVLWPPHAKSWHIGEEFDAGRDWGQEEKGTTEDEIAGWHHGLDGHESEWTAGDGDGQGGLACCDSWGRKESDTTERLNWTEMIFPLHSLFPRVLSELILLHNMFVVSAFKWKLLQLCPTLCNSMDCSPPGSSVHGILQSKNTVVGCHSLLQGIIPTQRPNLGLLDCRQIFYHLSYQGSPMWERLCLSHTKPFMLFRTCQSS